jgi:hypothetical protein
MTVLDELEIEHERLLQELEDVNLQLAKVRAQLDDHKAGLGIEREPGWLGRATLVRRRFAQETQRLQGLIGQSGRRLSRARQTRIETCFIESAREILDKEVFNQIWQAAHALSDKRLVDMAREAVEVTNEPTGAFRSKRTERERAEREQLSRSVEARQRAAEEPDDEG